jgi:hypothetical protein
MKLKILLFSDNTWNVCYENQIDDFIASHIWHNDVLRVVKILDAVPGEDRYLETYEEFSERVNSSLNEAPRRSIGQIVMETMINAYDRKVK